jgi:glutamyl-tRNA synthetase/glutamyl-Q tRNA(Asp) synthetase
MPSLDLPALARRLPARPLTRFAPSPTGLLHLGHVANAVYVWGVARALGGRVLLRVEDHDRKRSRPEYESALLEDLDWLGLVPDLGGAEHLRRRPSDLRQSDSSPVYASALERLAATTQVYACDCSRKEIEAEMGARANQETRYPGRCRDRGLPIGPGRGVRIALGLGAESFRDALRGDTVQDPAEQCGDLLLRDRAGNWTYQFAVVVDDVRQGVDLVIRGEDLLDSTGRQLRLARLLGRERPPVFLHHPLLRKPDGAKLSKASGDAGIRELRSAGASPESVLGLAASRIGLLAEPGDLRPADLATLFTSRPLP